MKAVFKIQYNTRWGEGLCLVARDKKYPMSWGDGGVWSVTLPSCTKADLDDYWYIVLRDGLIVRQEWEHHSTRAAAGAKEMVIVDNWIDCPIQGCRFTMKHNAPEFDVPGFRGAGTAVPVFSLRTGDDFGIGEFRDLRPLVDWAAGTGQCIIQLLPVTDTTREGGWKDSYPYSPISSFALHPLYIHLQDVGVEANDEFKAVQAELNSLSELDYPRVFKEKMSRLREAFSRNGEKDKESRSFRSFCRKNAFWLDEYAIFCGCRDGLDPDFWRWVQWHLDTQFSEEVAYARSRGVHFKGDLPIGVSADSADAYWHPDLFNLDSSTGAPPDFFSADGQNWGFPTYNWETMARNDYAWWKARLRKMSEYFDAFRIDHILGFFRIWEIPSEYSGGGMGHFNPALPYRAQEIEAMGLPLEGLFLPDPRNRGCFQPRINADRSALSEWQAERFNALYNDFFYHRHDSFWRVNALRKLPELLGATGMLACGEDLGMVPDCVNGVMHEQRILSLEMACMEKGRPWPELSVCATSSHDMATLRMQHALATGMTCHSDPRDLYDADMDPWEIRRSLWAHLDSASMLAIFPLQDWIALDEGLRRKDYMNERINEPADPLHHWRYRVHFDLSRLAGAYDLNGAILTLLTDSRRTGK